MTLTRRKIFTLLGIFILGGIIGGVIGESIGQSRGEYETSNFLSSFYSDGANLSTILAIKEKVFILSKLRDGKKEEAIEALENGLDLNLMLFFAGIYGSESMKKGIKQALKIAKDYRTKFPRATNHPATDKAVASALAEADY